MLRHNVASFFLMVFLSCTLTPDVLASSLPAPPIVQGESTPTQRDSVALEKEFGTPEFPEGIPYSKFISYINDDLTRKYFAIWKDVLVNMNALTEDDLETKLLFVKASNTGPGEGGDYFVVHYYVVIDWLKIKPRTLGFPIVWSRSRQEYKYLNLRTDVYLERQEIMKYLTIGHNDSSYRVELKKPLAFKSKEDALAALTHALEIDQIPDDRAVIQILDGTPMITAFVAINKGKNYCKRGRVDLITGEANVSRARCHIIN